MAEASNSDPSANDLESHSSATSTATTQRGLEASSTVQGQQPEMDNTGVEPDSPQQDVSTFDMVLPVERLRRGANTAQEYMWKGLEQVESSASEVARRAKEQSSTLANQEVLNHAKEDVGRVWETASRETTTGLRHLRKQAASVLRSGQGALATTSSTTATADLSSPSEVNTSSATNTPTMHTAAAGTEEGTTGNGGGTDDWESLTKNVTESVSYAVGWFGSTVGSALGYAAELVDTDTPSNDAEDNQDGEDGSNNGPSNDDMLA